MTSVKFYSTRYNLKKEEKKKNDSYKYEWYLFAVDPYCTCNRNCTFVIMNSVKQDETACLAVKFYFLILLSPKLSGPDIRQLEKPFPSETHKIKNHMHIWFPDDVFVELGTIIISTWGNKRINKTCLNRYSS